MDTELVKLSDVLQVIDALGYINIQDAKDYEANRRVDGVRMEILRLTRYTYDEEVEENTEAAPEEEHTETSALRQIAGIF